MFGPVPRKILTDSLVNVRQHEICLRIILNDIISCAKNVEALQVQLGKRLDNLKTTVHSKTAIPTAHVYVSLLSPNKKFSLRRIEKLIKNNQFLATFYSISQYLGWFSGRTCNYQCFK
jgi:hypothetical protein